MNQKEQTIYTWLQERIGEGYVWGASGYILTESKLNELIKQYPNNVSYEKNGKWLGKRVWDCAQLVRGVMKEVSIPMVSGATSQWKKTNWEEKGTIDTLPKNKIACLYRQTSDGVMQHTGIYTGDNYFIDARGSSSGVLKSKLSSYKWTHWGIPKGLYTNTTSTTTNTTSEVLSVLYKAIVTADTGKTVNMRNNPSRAADVVAQVPLGTPVDVIEESGEWSRIGVDGKTGYMMAQYLVKQDSIEPAQGYYVTIKCNSASEAKRLAELLGQAKVG